MSYILDAGERWSSFRRACRFGGPSSHWWLAIVLGVLSAVPSALLVIAVGVLVDRILNQLIVSQLIRNGQTPETMLVDLPGWLSPVARLWEGRQDFLSQLLAFLGVLLLLAMLESLLVWLHDRQVAKAAIETTVRIKSALYEQLARLTGGEGILQPPTDEHRSLLEDLDGLRRGLVIWWRTIPRATAMLALLVLLGLALDLYLTLLALVLAVVVWLAYHQMLERADRRARSADEQTARRREGFLDIFHAARVISAVAPPTGMIATFRSALDRYREDVLKATTIAAAPRPVLFLGLALSMFLMLLVVGLSLLDNEQSPRSSSLNLIILALAFSRSFVPVYRLRQALDVAVRADPAAARIFAVLDATPRIGQLAGAAGMPRLARGIRWESVSLQAAGDLEAIRSVSLAIPAGTTCGWLSTSPPLLKSLVQVALRFRDPDEGRVLFDDVDARNLTLQSLRRGTSFVGREGGLFSGTIFENIHCGRTACLKEDVEQAAELCGIRETILALPLGFHTTIGPLARHLPPHLALRIGIARAVVGDPSLLIIDEPPAPPDASTDEWSPLLQKLRQNRTVIVLAQQLETLRTADRIFVFHEHTLHAAGPHVDLLQQDALYRHLNYLLFNPFRDREPPEEHPVGASVQAG